MVVAGVEVKRVYVEYGAEVVVGAPVVAQFHQHMGAVLYGGGHAWGTLYQFVEFFQCQRIAVHIAVYHGEIALQQRV